MQMLKTTSLALMVATLVGCGGGGGGDLLIPVYTPFSGKVIDGYIKNAKVCLDLNSNLKCDDGPGQDEEKYTVRSGTGGSYSFTYFGTRDITTLHIIAEASEESIDEDEGVSFKEAGRSPVTLLTPAPAPEAITPLSTMVSNQQIVAKEEGKKLAINEAEKIAKVALGLPSTVNLVSNDYKDSNKGDTNVAQVAKAMTLALADTQKSIKSSDEMKASVSSSGKSLETEVMKQAVAIVKTEIVKNISSEGKLTTTVEAVKTSTAQVVQGQIQDIIKVAAAPKTTVMDPISYLKKGLYFLSVENGVWFGDGKKPESPVRNAGPAPVFSGVQLSDDGKSVRDSSTEWAIKTGDQKFSVKYKWPDNIYLVEGKGWVKSADTGGSVTADQNCMKIVGEVSSQEVCGKVAPWGGKTVKEAGFCTSGDKNTYFQECKNPDLVFPQDAYSNSFSLTELKDQYVLWSPDNGPNIPYTYKQTGTTITITATTGDHQVWTGNTVILDFISGSSKDGSYKVASVIDKASFTVEAKDSVDASGNALRYWGGWWGGNSPASDLKDMVKNRLSDSPFWYEDCTVRGQFIETSTGYAIQWNKGKSSADNYNNCMIDNSPEAKKYEQVTSLIFETVMGTPIMRSIAPDIYKLAKDEYYGIELLWAVADNSAGVKGVYNGELKRASVKREIISGLREALGNRSFIETIAKAWGLPTLPTDADLFGLSK